MKKTNAVMRILTVLLLAGGALAESNTDSAAVSAPFEIKAYSPKTGVVKIQCGGTETNRLFTSFSEAEQNEIAAWLVDKEFQGAGLSIEVEKKKETKKHETQPKHQYGYVSGLQGEVDSVRYAITVKNLTEVDFKELTVSSRVFYVSRNGTNEQNCCVIRTDDVDLLYGEILTVETDPVSIRDEKYMSPTRGVSTTGNGTIKGGAPTVFIKDRLLGLYVCVSKKDWAGRIIQVETEEGNVPDKEKWGDYTKERPKQRQIPGMIKRTKKTLTKKP